MHLVDQLEVYLNKTEDILEKSHVLKTLDFITRTPQAFERQHETRGHMGASAVVLSEDRTRILLSKHSVLGVWSFFGNHCDGSTDMIAVAHARIVKNVGAAFAQKCTPQQNIFDVDIHYVPAYTRKGEAVPEHLHYDIAYLFLAPYDAAIESTQNKWFSLKEAESALSFDTQHQRIWAKIATR